jgi:ribose 5-phosphate isomerase A
VTDEGNYILHCKFDGIADPAALERNLLCRAGVVGTGLFLGIAHEVIIGRPSGVEVRRRN